MCLVLNVADLTHVVQDCCFILALEQTKAHLQTTRQTKQKQQQQQQPKQPQQNNKNNQNHKMINHNKQPKALSPKNVGLNLAKYEWLLTPKEVSGNHPFFCIL